MSALPHPDIPEFYAEIDTLTHMQNLPDGTADQMVDVQLALGLSEGEFLLGLKWCVDHQLIILSGFDTQKH